VNSNAAQVAASDTRLLRVHNLRLPFRMQMIARRGRHLLASTRRRGVLAQGEAVLIERYRTVHYEGTTLIDPRVGYELHLLIHDDEPGSGTRSSLAARIALAVFREPACDWSIALAAERMQISARTLKAQLFRENNALTAIVREQRLMRALLALLADPQLRNDLASLAMEVGFASVSHMDDAFDAHFGCTASRVARLAWCRALTWSVVST
jgi:AraC-like DNA-binding protein